MYQPQPNDVTDAGGRQLVRARFIQHDTWLVYANCGDTCGAITKEANGKYMAHCNGRRRGTRKDLNAAISLLLSADERKEFLGA